MSKSEWNEGDLAIVTTRSGREYRAVYTLAPGIDYYWRQIGNERLRGQLADPDVSARPLVVIDPEDREQVERLEDLYLRDAHDDCDDTTGCMQAALREFANPTPPKPEEPQGLGAVVEDADGQRWVLVGPGDSFPVWAPSSADERVATSYEAIAAVRVLSEGVTE